MKIVKLNAINSTNTFLKDLASESVQENYTVVVAENQLAGKGQLDNKWHSDTGKSLTFSVLCKFTNLDVSKAFFLNCAISLAIYTVLKEIGIHKLTVKWPNDILSSNKKLCGILIENTIKKSTISQSIVGIGLNVNQPNFPMNLPNATSLKMVSHTEFDKEEVLHKILNEIKHQLQFVIDKKFELLKDNYESVLYKFKKPAMFSKNNHENFMGKILGISDDGKLIIELNNSSIETFNLKEIQFKNTQ